MLRKGQFIILLIWERSLFPMTKLVNSKLINTVIDLILLRVVQFASSHVIGLLHAAVSKPNGRTIYSHVISKSAFYYPPL